MRSYEPAEIAAEIKHAVLYSDDPGCEGNTVRRIAGQMGLSEWTVRDYLEGRIKPSLAFLHAACVATGGHPDIARFLQPEGFHLIRDIEVVAACFKSVEGELLDAVEAIGKSSETIRESIRDGHISRDENTAIMRSIATAETELAELKARVQEETKGRGLKPVA